MSENTSLSRRDLVKFLAAAGGSLSASILLPGRWIKPEIASGVLPAHAQATEQCTVGELVSISATTTTTINDLFVDFDLYVRTPDGTLMAFDNQGPHQGATHHGDNAWLIPPGDSEVVTISGPASGTYQVGVRYIQVGSAPNLSIRVSIVSGNCAHTFQRTIVDDSPSDPMHIADITFPAGTVVGQSGPFGITRARASTKND
jgi:hypothetical protein